MTSRCDTHARNPPRLSDTLICAKTKFVTLLHAIVYETGGWPMAYDFAETLRRRLSRWIAVRELRSLDRIQRGELARDIGLPEDVLGRLIARGGRTDDQSRRLMYALELDMNKIRSFDSGVARDISVVCSECLATSQCQSELAAGTALKNYHEYCPNAETFDALRQELGCSRRQDRTTGTNQSTRSA